MVKILKFEEFLRSIKQNKSVVHSMILGAGASIESGIPSAIDCIWEWKKDIFISHNPNLVDNYANTKSELNRTHIQKWLDRNGNFIKNGGDNEYSYYAEKAYPILSDRKKYFHNLSKNSEPSIGYKLICMLAEYGLIRSVWTTNFDGLTIKAANNKSITTIEVALDSIGRIYRKESTDELLYVALHGDYKYGEIKNTKSELDSQDEVLIEALSHELRNRNLIVIGYSGRDKSLMEALKKVYSGKGSGRLYWCGYGENINSSVEDLLNIATKNNREAFFVPTDGFDQTMLKISLNFFENNSTRLKELKELINQESIDIIKNTSFINEDIKINKVIKSNLIPVVIPKKVYEFKINMNKGINEWDICRDLGKRGLITVTYLGKFYSFSNSDRIKEKLKGKLIGDITLVDLSSNNIIKIGAFKKLVISSILKALTNSNNLETDGYRIWSRDDIFSLNINNKKIIGYDGIKPSLEFDYKYFYISILPNCYIKDYKKYIKSDIKNFNDQFYYKIGKIKTNKNIDLYIKKWITKLTNDKKIKINFSKDKSKLTFGFSCNPLYTGLKTTKNESIPKYLDKKQIVLKGKELDDPNLVFFNPRIGSYRLNFHPMQGLIDNQPYDYSMGIDLKKNEINIGVLCPEGYENKLASFLNSFNNQHVAKVNPDYLISYPGFSKIYGLPLIIPMKDSPNWIPYRLSKYQDINKTGINLGKEINRCISKLNNNNEIDVIVIYIPKSYELYTSSNNKNGFDLHDYVKAYAVQNNISTQFLREDTIESNLDCQIAWSMSLAFYVKSLRTPWIINNQEDEVAFAGIGYSHSKNNYVVGCSHIYSSNGQGMKYKLSRITDFTLDKRKNPYLSNEEAYKLGISIKELFFKSFSEVPRRVVVHKRTKFTKDEIKGFVNSILGNGIEELDLIEINYERSSRFFELRNGKIDDFPIKRGVCFPVESNKAFLYTHGIAPSIRNPKYRYIQGGKSLPVPLKIIKHYGQGDLSLIGREILGLSKMDWNSFELYSKLPCTIVSAKMISKIGKYIDYSNGKVYDYRNFM